MLWLIKKKVYKFILHENNKKINESLRQLYFVSLAAKCETSQQQLYH